MADIGHIPHARRPDEWDWQRDAAACRGMPTSVFYHPAGERTQAETAGQTRTRAAYDPHPTPHLAADANN